ncbi:hypothetical protein GCM10027066_28600 [Dyella jejuensis]
MHFGIIAEQLALQLAKLTPAVAPREPQLPGQLAPTWLGALIAQALMEPAQQTWEEVGFWKGENLRMPRQHGLHNGGARPWAADDKGSLHEQLAPPALMTTERASPNWLGGTETTKRARQVVVS